MVLVHLLDVLRLDLILCLLAYEDLLFVYRFVWWRSREGICSNNKRYFTVECTDFAFAISEL